MRSTSPDVVPVLPALAATRRAPRSAAWPALLGLLPLVLLGCAARQGPPAPERFALCAQDAGDARVSLVFASPDEALLERLAAALSSLPGRPTTLRAPGGLELSLTLPESALPARFGEIAGAANAVLPSRSTPPAVRVAGVRELALDLARTDTVSPWTWHASAAASPESAECVRQALASLEGRVATFESTPDSVSSGEARFVLVDGSASEPSELRWTPGTEQDREASPDARAEAGLAAALFARAHDGWTFVPASIDLFGRREPAYLYSSADFATAKSRLETLFTAALARPLDAEAAAEVLRARAAYAAAQLARPEFRLRALHGPWLERFERDARALAEFGGPGGQALPSGLDPRSGRLSVVGPREAWEATLAAYGTVLQRQAPAPAGDAAAEERLARLWTALGGLARWRELRTVRLLGTLTLEDGTRQGVEQWVDLAGGRFALAQAIGSQETVIAATAAEAWIVDGAQGTDLEPEQARKFRGRGERTWFTVLFRLSREGRDGLALRAEGERLLVLEGPRLLCWIQQAADGTLARLGYRLDDGDAESVYEFADWTRDGALPYPARTLQVERKATFEIEHLESNGALDPALWRRG